MPRFGLKKNAPAENDPPFKPTVNICLQIWSTDESGTILVTPTLISDIEIDCEIDSMIRELEKHRKTAKSFIATARGSAAWCRANAKNNDKP